MKHVVTTGIVLARTDFGEADRILTILTPDQGKLRVMAKGVRKVKSKLAGGIELLSVSNITFIPGRKGIGTLVSSRLETHFGRIVEDLDRTMLAYELLKKINKTTEDEPGGEYFEVLKVALAALDAAVALPVVEAWFDAQLLKLAGHQPNVETDEKGNKLQGDQTFTFNTEHMCFSANTNARYTPRHITILRLLLEQPSPQKVSKVDGVEQYIQPVQQLLAMLTRQQ